MSVKNKVTWKNVYEDFKQRHPKLAKEVFGWHPHGFATILLIFSNGVHRLYNYDTKKVSSKIDI